MTGWRTVPVRACRFVGVAVIGMAVQLGVLTTLVDTAAMDLAAATAAAVAVAVVHNYAWHERWTWADRPVPTPRARAFRFLRFVALTGTLSIAGNVVLTVALVGGLGAPVALANVLAVGALGVANFCAAHMFVFVRRPESAPVASRGTGLGPRASRVSVPRLSPAPRCTAHGSSGCRG